MNQKSVKHEGRQPTDTITKEHLAEFIATTQDDFALELYAYSLARRLGYEATHAGSYIDPQSGKARQFDVQARVACGEHFHVYFAIECKFLRPSFPLLVSQIPRISAESYQHIVMSNGKWRSLMLMTPHAHPLTHGASLYPQQHYVGKALSQVGFNGEGKLHSKDAEVFEKWGQAIASSSQLLNKAAFVHLSIHDPSEKAAVLPVLVVPEGTLWAVNYDENGNLVTEPFQTDEVQYFIGSTQRINVTPPIDFLISYLHIVTKTGLQDLLVRFQKHGQDTVHLLGMLS